MSTPRISGNWMPVDSSKNTIELAATDDTNVLAFRDTYEPNTVTRVTKSQIMHLAEAVNEGRLRNLIQG